MSENQSTPSVDPILNPASVYFLHPSESGQKLVSEIFRGIGYGDWKRAMVIALSGKNKLAFVDGSLPKPSTNQLEAKAWDRVNNVVIGWILAVLDTSIAKSVIWFHTAKEIWDELEERYGQSSNAQLFALQEECNSIVQTEDMSIAEYFTKLKSLWDELDSLNPLPTCSCSSCSCNLTQKFYKLQQNQRLMHFLMKIDPKYSQIRSNILMMSPLPPISQAYRLLSQEQKHQELNKLNIEHTESMAFNSHKGNPSSSQKPFTSSSYSKPAASYNNNKRTMSGNKRPSNTYFCDHCKVPGHGIERCWKIHGYPPNFKPNSKSQFKPNTWTRPVSSTAHAAQSESNDTKSAEEPGLANLTPEQYKRLLALVNDGPSDEHLMDDTSRSTSHGNAFLAGPLDERALGSW